MIKKIFLIVISLFFIFQLTACETNSKLLAIQVVFVCSDNIRICGFLKNEIETDQNIQKEATVSLKDAQRGLIKIVLLSSEGKTTWSGWIMVV